MLAAPGLRLLTRAWRRGRLQAAAGRRAFCAAAEEGGRAGQGQQPQRPPLEPGLLDILVCPLSKKPLSNLVELRDRLEVTQWSIQLSDSNLALLHPALLPLCLLSHGIHKIYLGPLWYEESTSELINDELGIAYPIVDGIPNMIPEAARMIGKESQEKEPEQT